MQWTQSPILIRIRFFASIVLVFYTATHFINHALGLLSLEALEEGRKIFLAFWRNSIVQVVFPLALFLHAQSALWRLMFRQSWRFNRREQIKIFSGLAIPFFLLMHLAGTRLQWWFYGYNDSYAWFLLQNIRSGDIWPLFIMAILVWVHAWYGATATLDLKPWFLRHRSFFLASWLVLPTLGISGIVAAAMQVMQRARDEAWVTQVVQAHGGDPQRVNETKLLFYFGLLGLLALLIASLLVVRFLLVKRGRRNANIPVQYADGPAVNTHSGSTILEVSLVNGIEHAHVCGGNGRCSTCRVRVMAGTGHLSPAGTAENAILKKIGAEADVRLACQARVLGEIRIAPLIAASQATNAGAALLLSRGAEANGTEREVVIFFSDLKGFTSFSESKLPYDVVFVLNQYFRSMGKIIEQHHGFIDKFIGDGIMAIFGLNEDTKGAARHALAASLKMHDQLERINEFLAEEIASPLEIRIGLHSGHAIVGDMGYGNAIRTTAIGDAVNTASRLEHANKKMGTWLLFSEAVAENAGFRAPEEFHARVQLRGKAEPLSVYGIPKDKKFNLEDL